MNQDELLKIVDEIEAEQALNRISGASVFRTMLNQPNFVAISSADKVDENSSSGFSSFRVNLPRPILQAETIQLVNANIPQCVQNIPDTACVFWYYKMSAYSGELPCLNNLHFVRLLPSYYKKEFIENENDYGYNQTFTSYQDVEEQLALACLQDLGNVQYANYVQPSETNLISSRFLPNDISITFNSDINKFEMKGNNCFTPPAYLAWNAATNYNENDKVFLVINEKQVSFTALNNNINQNPQTSNDWFADNGEVIQQWDANVIYTNDRIVVRSGNLYIASETTFNEDPLTHPTEWVPIPSEFVWNTYLITGYADENVKKAQSRVFRPFESSYVFETNDVVDYNGVFYKALEQTANVEPLSPLDINIWKPVSTPIKKIGAFGTLSTGLVLVECDSFMFTSIPLGSDIYISGASSDFFNLYPTNGFLEKPNIYQLAQVLSNGVVLVSNINFANISANYYSAGGRICTEIAPDYGLQALSGQYDFAITDVYDIPAQPANPNPKRLLNSILGFTWNGVFTKNDFGPDYSQNRGFYANRQNVSFFNRLRPVAPYTIRPIPIPVPPLRTGLGRYPGVIAEIFTADGYCNLVYSSVMSIYASVIGGSTLTSTKENNGLLALASMNCQNLGVSYFQENMAHPLSLYGSDIYTIIFNLEDEMGESYYLTNNAVLSLVLKVEYK